MRNLILILALIFHLVQSLNAQSRSIFGCVIGEDLELLPMVNLYNKDTILLGKTDLDGRFKIDIPITTDEILISWLGLEWTTIQFDKDCDTLEIVVMYDYIYDFITSRKIDRLRLKRFQKLPEIHDLAYKKGLIYKREICYELEFKPCKADLDIIGEEMNETKKKIKQTYKDLRIGDTISIPFDGYKGMDTTELIVWSAYTNEEEFNCVAQGVIKEKYKKKNGFKIMFLVTDIDLCGYPTMVYEGKEMKVGEIFEYDMKYYKILIKE